MEGGNSGDEKKGRESRCVLKVEMMRELTDVLIGCGNWEEKHFRWLFDD